MGRRVKWQTVGMMAFKLNYHKGHIPSSRQGYTIYV